MKKSYLLMAAAATMFAACSETDFVQKVNTQQAITFEGFAGKTTRAEITDVDALKDENVGFKVWGFGVNESSYDLPFDGTQVKWDNEKKWYYDVLKYWDADYVYSFYAVAPYNQKSSFIEETEKYKISDVVSGKAAEVIDYLTATPVTGIPGSAGQPVSFTFNHIMSKVSVQLATSATGVTIHSVTMTGWNAAEADYYHDGNAYIWDQDDPELEGTATFYDAGTTTTVVNEEDVTTDNYERIGNVVTSPYLMVPQGANNLTFNLVYKVGNVLYDQNVTVNDQTWGINHHTTYVLNIGVGAITFTVVDVEDWDDQDDVHGSTEP